jgi:hypothetical protein
MENPYGIIWPVSYLPSVLSGHPLRSGPSLRLYAGLCFAPSEVSFYLVHIILDHHLPNSSFRQIPSCSINKEPSSWTHQKKTKCFWRLIASWADQLYQVWAKLKPSNRNRPLSTYQLDYYWCFVHTFSLPFSISSRTQWYLISMCFVLAWNIWS